MRLLFHRDAIGESIEATNYYDAQRRGLGREFDKELEAAFPLILQSPRMWPAMRAPNVHRYRLKRFPYGVVYRTDADAVTVIAVAHLKRKPDYWMNRL